jgi:quercetin dioxygenase-like cupin family protein
MGWNGRLRTLVLAALLAFGASSGSGQDPAKLGDKQLQFSIEKDQVVVKVDPGIYNCTLENERVRVCDITFKPGAKIDRHWHPDRVVYSIGGGTLTVAGEDGKVRDIVYRPGDMFWFTASSHAAANYGSVDVRLIMIELKEPAKR